MTTKDKKIIDTIKRVPHWKSCAGDQWVDKRDILKAIKKVLSKE